MRSIYHLFTGIRKIIQIRYGVWATVIKHVSFVISFTGPNFNINSLIKILNNFNNRLN